MKSARETLLAGTVAEILEGALERALGAAATRRHGAKIQDCADLLAERYIAKGLDVCTVCGHLAYFKAGANRVTCAGCTFDAKRKREERRDLSVPAGQREERRA